MFNTITSKILLIFLISVILLPLGVWLYVFSIFPLISESILSTNAEIISFKEEHGTSNFGHHKSEFMSYGDDKCTITGTLSPWNWNVENVIVKCG